MRYRVPLAKFKNGLGVMQVEMANYQEGRSL
jgi:hypothetical protein